LLGLDKALDLLLSGASLFLMLLLGKLEPNRFRSVVLANGLRKFCCSRPI
jgi:hypothetical protein